jgi:hypothetical protein
VPAPTPTEASALTYGYGHDTQKCLLGEKKVVGGHWKRGGCEADTSVGADKRCEVSNLWLTYPVLSSGIMSPSHISLRR